MRFVGMSSFALLMLGACSAGFSASETGDAGTGGDGNPLISGETPKDGGADGTEAAEGGHPDATAGDAGVIADSSAGETGPAADATTDTGASEAGSPTCANGDLDCNGSCVPSDVNNCGTCGHSCTDLPHVSGATSCTAAGACSFPPSACATGWADCDGNPDNGCEVNITTPASCGSCTNTCPTSTPVCAGGTCVTGCPTGTPELCSGTCVDTTSNPSDCNGCSNVCPDTVSNSQPACVSGACTFTCNSNFTGCPVSGPTACVDESTDPGNCGACGKTCPGPTSGTGQPACAAGACTLSCSAGLTACPTAAPTECVDTTDDTNNCGGCGDVCTTTVANAHVTCASSQCGFACNSGFLLCNATSCIGPDPTGLFVSPKGTASTGCTATSPCSSIAAAIAAAGSNTRTIYLDQGTYTEQVALATNITIQGGWTWGQSAGTWTNCNGSNATSVIAAPAGVSATVVSSGGVLETLSITNDNTVAQTSSFGVSTLSGTTTLTSVSIAVAAGAGGTNGVQGTGGTAGAAAGSCTAQGGTNGATGQAGAPGPQGTYSAGGFAPGNGGTNTASGTGGAGQNGSAASTTVPCVATPPCCNSEGCGSCGGGQTCGQQGTNGCGGGGGGPGTGGTGGYSSIGVFAGGSAVVNLSGVSIQTGTGGQGGNGGAGGGAGPGSDGQAGAGQSYTATCESTPSGCKDGETCTGCEAKSTATVGGGPAGGNGGSGGVGGQGGGGAGGDSLCYATGGGGAVNGSPGCTPGAGGLGGNQGGVSQGATGRSGMHN